MAVVLLGIALRDSRGEEKFAELEVFVSHLFDLQRSARVSIMRADQRTEREREQEKERARERHNKIIHPQSSVVYIQMSPLPSQPQSVNSVNAQK